MIPEVAIEQPAPSRAAEVCVRNRGGAVLSPVVVDRKAPPLPKRNGRTVEAWMEDAKRQSEEIVSRHIRFGDIADGETVCVDIPAGQIAGPVITFREPRINRSIDRLGGDQRGGVCEFPWRWRGYRLEFTYTYRSGFSWGCDLKERTRLPASLPEGAQATP